MHERTESVRLNARLRRAHGARRRVRQGELAAAAGRSGNERVRRLAQYALLGHITADYITRLSSPRR